MRRRIQQTKSEPVRLKHKRYRATHVGKEEEARRNRWLQDHVGRRVKRRRGVVEYLVIGPDQLRIPFAVDVVRLRRGDGSEFTVGYREAMNDMEVVP